MSGEKVVFHVGAFGIGAKLINDVVHILVNVRTDQDRQRELAKLAADSTVLLVDCPGGAVKQDDASLYAGLVREIQEELGCNIAPLGDFSQPLELMGKRPAPYDLAFWMPVRYLGEIKPTNEAKEHPWVSLADLEAATTYRPVSGLGLAGRTGKMMKAAFAFFEANRAKTELFS